MKSIRYDLVGFGSSDFVVTCRTRREARKFLGHLDKMGFTWPNGENLTRKFLWARDTFYGADHGKIVIQNIFWSSKKEIVDVSKLWFWIKHDDIY